ncbi:amino acid permease-domain-containing protein [Entophlyctis helioformis]|nr:amino acid permease-domain-containing protein [Entophlyctis helioformis]
MPVTGILHSHAQALSVDVGVSRLQAADERRGPDALLEIDLVSKELKRTLDQEYVERRQLGEPFANRWHIWGVIVGIVISGEFAGFNLGLIYGFGSMIAAHVIVTIMVMCVSASCAEMAAMFPFSSACVVYSYAAFGGLASTLLGFSYCIELIMISGQAMVYFGNSMTALTQLPDYLEPVWWLIGLGLCTCINLKPRLFFEVNAYLALLSCVILVGILAAQVKFVDLGATFKAWRVVDALHFTSVRIMSEGLTWSDAFPGGVWGVARALPSAMYLYVGFEVLPVIAEESLHARKTLPEGMFAGMMTLIPLATGALIISSATVPPGLAAISRATFPQVTSLSAILGCADTSAGSSCQSGLVLLIIPGILASSMSSIYGYSRYMYALARGGYLPAVLALTSKNDRAPFVALTAGAVLMACVAIAVKYANASDAFLDTAAIFALMAWVFDMAVYVKLKIWMPNLDRPFHSPFGILGAVYVILVSSAGIIGLAYISKAFLLIVFILIGIGVVLTGFYFLIIRKTLSASPEKEFVRQQLDSQRRQGRNRPDWQKSVMESDVSSAGIDFVYSASGAHSGAPDNVLKSGTGFAEPSWNDEYMHQAGTSKHLKPPRFSSSTRAAKSDAASRLGSQMAASQVAESQVASFVSVSRPVKGRRSERSAPRPSSHAMTDRPRESRWLQVQGPSTPTESVTPSNLEGRSSAVSATSAASADERDTAPEAD